MHCKYQEQSFYIAMNVLYLIGTSEGFDLTRDLKLALDSRSCIEGNMSCTGKEDWKYLKASGCACRTSIKYTIEPEFYQVEI